MAPRKARSDGTAPRRRSAPAAAPAAPRDPAGRAAVETGGNSNRLLREAAWSRMFGRVETKNPFTR